MHSVHRWLFVPVCLIALVRSLQNVVVNGDFDHSTTRWTWTPTPNIVISTGGRDGHAALLSCQPPTQCILSQVVDTDSATAYGLSFWLRQTGTRRQASDAYFEVFLGPSSQDEASQALGQTLHLDPASLSFNWTEFSFEVPGHGPATLLSFKGSGASESFALDDVTLTSLGPVQLVLASSSASAGPGGVSSSSSAGGASSGSSNGSGSGLSPGATAGTVVGVVVAVIGCGTALFEWLKSRNQTKLADIATGQGGHPRPQSSWIPWR